MSFGTWFLQWIDSFFKLLTVGSKKRRTEAQRKEEHERKLKEKFSGAKYYRPRKERRRRRSSHSVQNERMIVALFRFMAISLGVLLLPLGLLDWGRKNAKARRATKSDAKSGVKSGASAKKATPNGNHVKKTAPMTTNPITAKAATKKSAPKKPAANATGRASPAKAAPKEPVSYSYTPMFDRSAPEMPPTVTEPDENTPKSAPKNEKDQYIRKRMIIAGSQDCDKAVLELLAVGSYIDLAAEADDPCDKDAVKLLFNGEKIGYVAKNDRAPFVTCMRLKRRL